MLCSENKPLAGLRERETLRKCVLLSDCPARQKNRFGTHHYTCIFVGVVGVREIDLIFIFNREVYILVAGPFMHTPPSP